MQCRRWVSTRRTKSLFNNSQFLRVHYSHTTHFQISDKCSLNQVLSAVNTHEPTTDPVHFHVKFPDKYTVRDDEPVVDLTITTSNLIHLHLEGPSTVCLPALSVRFTEGSGGGLVKLSNLTLVTREALDVQLQRRFQQRLMKQLFHLNVLGTEKSSQRTKLQIENCRILGHADLKHVDLEMNDSELNRFYLSSCDSAKIHACTFGNLYGEGYTTNDLKVNVSGCFEFEGNTVWYSTLSLEQVSATTCSITNSKFRTSRPGIRLDHCDGRVQISSNTFFDAGIQVLQVNEAHISQNSIAGVECAVAIQEEPNTMLVIDQNVLRTKPCLSMTSAVQLTNKLSFNQNSIHTKSNIPITEYFSSDSQNSEWIQSAEQHNSIVSE